MLSPIDTSLERYLEIVVPTWHLISYQCIFKAPQMHSAAHDIRPVWHRWRFQTINRVDVFALTECWQFFARNVVVVVACNLASFVKTFHYKLLAFVCILYFILFFFCACYCRFRFRLLFLWLFLFLFVFCYNCLCKFNGMQLKLQKYRTLQPSWQF